MRKPCVAGNWKMYKTVPEAIELAQGIKRVLADVSQVDIVLCPPATALKSVQDVVSKSVIKTGAQNLFWEAQGAYTGEIAAAMIQSCGAAYVIVGHSERRKYFGETDETVYKKIISALAHKLIPIVCVGETLQEREANKTMDVIKTQLEGALARLSSDQVMSILIAYEPVWAIGTGKTALPDQAQEVHQFIRDWIAKKFSQAIASGLRILYGGSVKPDNIRDLMAQKDIDGALVGGASLKVESFAEIVKNAL